MENNSAIDLSKYDEAYLYRLIELGFEYYDTFGDKDKYEEDVEDFISNSAAQAKSNETKANVKYLIDYIDKYSNADASYIEESLKAIRMRQSEIELFKKLRLNYLDKIQGMKLALNHKLTNGRIVDFKHNFYVKYVDSSSDKVEFLINLFIKYLDDDYETKTMKLDLTISQFYQLFSDFQKIDTMIKTLI